MGKEEESGEYGEPNKFDPNFKGPLDKRSCTDIICCILFIVCFVGMILIGIIAFANGDPRLLLYPTDSEGHLCGYGDYEDKPNLFFFDLIDCAKLGAAVVINGCPTPQICIKECPSTNFYWGVTILDDSERENLICKFGIDPTNETKSVEELVKDEDCAAYYVESEPVLGRCFPAIFEEGFDILEDLYDEVNEEVIKDRDGNNVTKGDLKEGSEAVAALLNAKEYGIKIYQDVRATWWMIIIGLVVAMILSFIWILLMRFLAFPMVWITIILFVAIFGFATYYCFDKYIDMKDNPDHDLVGDVAITTDLDYYTNLSDTWLALGIISAAFLLIILLVILFLRSRILIAIALIKETSKAVGHMVFTLFWPILPFILQLILFGYWGAAAIFLASMGSGQYRDTNSTNITLNGSESIFDIQDQAKEVIQQVPCNPDDDDAIGEACSFLKYGDDEYTKYLQIFMLFMLFWVMNFIVALSQMVLAGSFASYYWAFKKPKDIPAFPVTGSVCRTLRYHLGTLAFGSLIIAIVQMIRVALEYLDQKLKGSENQVARFAVKCLKCCFWCLEKIIKFINKNAYILTAVYGYNFCTAAKNAFMLIMRNIVRVAVVDKVTDFIVFVGKLVIVGAVGVASFYFFSGRWEEINDYVDAPELNYYLVPVIIIAIGSYVIASCFFSVYNMGVDTLFLCFLEDIERHDGSAQKPYYMSRSLMKLLGKKNAPEVERARRGK